MRGVWTEEGGCKGCAEGGGGGPEGRGDEDRGVFFGIGLRGGAKGEGGGGQMFFTKFPFHVAAAVVPHFHHTLLLIYHPYYHLNWQIRRSQHRTPLFPNHIHVQYISATLQIPLPYLHYDSQKACTGPCPCQISYC